MRNFTFCVSAVVKRFPGVCDWFVVELYLYVLVRDVQCMTRRI